MLGACRMLRRRPSALVAVGAGSHSPRAVVVMTTGEAANAGAVLSRRVVGLDGVEAATAPEAHWCRARGA